jgi:hypothetical protein
MEIVLAALSGRKTHLASSKPRSITSSRVDLAERDRVQGGLGGVSPLGRFVLRSQEFRRLARLEVRQDGRLLARSRPARLIPERPAHLGTAWLA